MSNLAAPLFFFGLLSHQPLDHFRRFAEQFEVFRPKLFHPPRQFGDSAHARFLKQPLAFVGRMQAHDAGICFIGDAQYQSRANQGRRYAAHGWWSDLLGGGERTQSIGAAEYDD